MSTLALSAIPRRAAAEPYDVAILGTGIAGSALGAILARHGVSTVLIDAGTHPRFSIGESTIPATSLMWSALAQRFEIPELGHLAGYQNVSRYVSKSCGIKQNFGFVHHTDGAEPAEDSAQQLALPSKGAHESHLFRQDVDAYLFAVAIAAGAVPMQRTRVARLETGDDDVLLEIEGGDPIRARCVVDATGPGSPFARALGLRAKEAPFETRTRSLFTHMIGVEPYDSVLKRPAARRLPLATGTLHHVFDSGWIWVIPFNNAPDSLNPLISVGLTLDRDRHPSTGASPEDEFASVLARFPSVERQFARARAVRPWVSAPRLQWGSTRTIAPRYVMMASTAGFIGPLFSMGLAHTTETIARLAPRLIAASRDGDWGLERFEPIDAFHRRALAYNDALLKGAFVAFRDADLWDMWFRVWCLSQMPREMLIMEAMSDTLRVGREAAWQRFEAGHERHPFARLAGAVVDEAVAIVKPVDRGEKSPVQAVTELRALLAQADLGPLSTLLRTERQLMVPGRRRLAVASAARWLASEQRTPELTRTWARFAGAVARVART